MFFLKINKLISPYISIYTYVFFKYLNEEFILNGN